LDNSTLGGGVPVQTPLQDFRYGLRILWKSPGFTIVAVLTLALGIGATTAIFSIVNGVLLRPLPFAHPEQLISIGGFDNRRAPAIPNQSISYPNFFDVRARSQSFSDVAAYQDNEYTLTGAGPSLHVNAEIISASLFRLLGTNPAVGRGFLDSEDEPGHLVAVLSEAFWRRQFNADPTVVGRPVNLNGRSYTVVGVMPAGFQFPVRAQARDIWLTFSRLATTDDPKDTPMTAQRGNDSINVIARLKSRVNLNQANADLSSITHALAIEYPTTNSSAGIAARSHLEDLVGDTRTPLLVLFGAVGLVLLIACANVANLLLARASGRAREMAIRAALGASRGRVIRQLIAESLALSLAGAALGIAAASSSLRAILALYPSNLPRAQEVSVDYRVLLFTVGVAMVTGTTSRGHHRLRSGLVIAETAFGVTLLIGAGLLIRSFNRLSHADLGFNSEHLLTASFDLSETRYNADQQDQFVQRLLNRIRALPGVTSAAGAIPLPLNDDHFVVSFNVLDHPAPKENEPSSGFYVVAPGFFETMQIPLVRGRTFDGRDQRNSAPVMIVTREFAKKYFPNEDPIGKRVRIGAGDGAARANYKIREIVGIVGDIRNSDLVKPADAAYYIPLPQLMWGPPTLTIRAPGDPSALAGEIRKILASMDPDAPLYDVRTMVDYLALDLGRARFQTVLLGLFAAIALLLTAVGLYGVMSYTVVQRTPEIGIRMALGANKSDVLGMILARSFRMTGFGLLFGILGAFVLTRLLSSLLYEVKPADPLTFVVVAVVLGAVSLIASYVPAWRAARVNPMVALRHE
jgi:ABC-type antimicrobial peptide transport system permease subunit